MTGDRDDISLEILDALASGLPAVDPPGVSLKARLFGRVRTKDRFLPFLDRLAKMFDFNEQGAREQLDTIDQDDEWDDMLPGIRFRDFEAGPALGEAHGGFVRVQPGSKFPHHSHIGEETMLILQGRLRDETGKEYRAGDFVISDDGTVHELETVGDREVIYAAAVIALQFTETDDDDWDDEDDDD